MGRRDELLVVLGDHIKWVDVQVLHGQRAKRTSSSISLELFLNIGINYLWMSCRGLHISLGRLQLYQLRIKANALANAIKQVQYVHVQVRRIGR